MSRALALLVAVLLLGAVGPRAVVPQKNGWSFDTADLVANLKTGDFSAPGRVHMVRADGSTVDADRAEGNFKKRITQLYGHVMVNDATGTFNGVTATASKGAHGPAKLDCDALTVDEKSKTYVADGNVHYAQRDSTADAQHAVLNDRTHRLVMNGDVHLVRADRTMDSQVVTYDTKTGSVVANTEVRLNFPSGAHPSIATPRPIVIKNTKIVH
jgi:lipopolysaccharide export system protein LptA